MTLLRLQAVHKHRSGLPRDNIVNTWHVNTAVPVTLASAEACAEAVRDFYISDPPTQAESVCDLFADQVNVSGHEVRVYPIDVATGINAAGDGEPPLFVEVFDHLPRGVGTASGGLPSEVAVCLSYRNKTDGAVPQRRRRGRVYIGPLKPSNIAEAEFQTPRPPAGVQDLLNDAAAMLKTKLTTAGATWVVYSRPYEGRDVIERVGKPDLPAIAARVGSTHVIDEVWVDDSFDTVRRRGERPTGRLIQAI